MLLGSVNLVATNRYQDRGYRHLRNDAMLVESLQNAEKQMDTCATDCITPLNGDIPDVSFDVSYKNRGYGHKQREICRTMTPGAETDMQKVYAPIQDMGHVKNDGTKYRRGIPTQVKVQAEMVDRTYCRRQGEKLTSDQSRRQASRHIGRGANLSPLGNKDRGTPETECESARSSGYISSGSVSSFSRNQSPLSSPEVTRETSPEVTIRTADDYNVYIEPTFFSVTLRKQRTPNANSTFTQAVIQSTDLSRGRSHVVTFSLLTDPNYFLTTNRCMCLELKVVWQRVYKPRTCILLTFELAKACPDDIPTTPSYTDERLFMLYESPDGSCFVQPYRFKGRYFHHMDGNLSISKLELNFRPPEEFLFQIIQSPSSSRCSSQSPPSSRRYDQSRQLYQKNNTRTRPDNAETDYIHHTSYPVYAINDLDNNANAITYFNQNFTYIDNSAMNNSSVLTYKHNTSPSPLLTDDNGNSEVPSVGEVKLRKSKRNKISKDKRSSLYNVVAMTGSCFGLGHKE